MAGDTNLNQRQQQSEHEKSDPESTNLPPMKWRPLKYFTSGLGAVRLTRAVGLKVLPSPDFGGPSSMFQDDGASTEVTGSFVSSMALMTAGKGSRTSPEKLKPASHERPKMATQRYGGEDQPNTASTIWSVDSIAVGKSSVKGTSRSSSCFASR